MSIRCRLVVLGLLISGLAAPALAQDQPGARISGFYSAALGQGGGNIETGGSVGYRFTPRLGIDFEQLALPAFQLDDAGMPGRGVAFLTNFVSEFHSPASWLTPYVQVGGGVANIRLEPNVAAFDREDRLVQLPRRSRNGRFPNLPDDVRVVQIGAGRRDTSVALNVGSGVDFAVWKVSRSPEHHLLEAVRQLPIVHRPQTMDHGPDHGPT